MSDWKAGDKALCIESMPGIHRCLYDNPNGLPQKGTIYLVVDINIDDNGNVGLLLAGHPVFTMDGREVGYGHQAFRKVVPRSERKEERKCAVIGNGWDMKALLAMVADQLKLENGKWIT